MLLSVFRDYTVRTLPHLVLRRDGLATIDVITLACGTLRNHWMKVINPLSRHQIIKAVLRRIIRAEV